MGVTALFLMEEKQPDCSWQLVYSLSGTGLGGACGHGDSRGAAGPWTPLEQPDEARPPLKVRSSATTYFFIVKANLIQIFCYLKIKIP